MSCSNITQGISKGCNNNLGGIRNIYISEQPITGYVLSGDLITGFSPSPTWLTVEADQGTGNFTETYEINQAGSIIAFKQSVTFQINDLSAYNQQRIAELAESTNLGVVVEMNNGKYFTVGIERGAYLETGSTSSGTGYGDLSGSTITITGIEKISSLEVSPVIIGPYVQIRLWGRWTETATCQGGSGPSYVFGNDSQLSVAKCEFDAGNEYMALDPNGCYPAGGTTIAGITPIKKLPVGVEFEIGVHLYDFTGGLSNYTGIFWYLRGYPFPQTVWYNTGTIIQFNPLMSIGRVQNGIVTELTNQSNVTC